MKASLISLAAFTCAGLSTGTATDKDIFNPLTAVERLAMFEAKDFAFDLAGAPATVQPGAGSIRAVTVANLPSLFGQGLAYALIDLEPCGINLPHIHPRATELLYVIEGHDLRVAFVQENGGNGAVVNDLDYGEVSFFQRGLIHYEQNLSCEPVRYIAALNSEDPGAVTITTRFFELPEEALQASLNIENDKLQQLIAGLPANPAQGARECRKRCGLDKAGHNLRG